LSAHTFADDIHLRQLSIRRLMILLRKVLLRWGMRNVFEPNTDRLRQRISSSLESLLSSLMGLGAFVGFDIATEDAVSSQGDIDDGRFIVTIRVAPTNPVEFITISLLRTNDAVLNIVEA
jgi:phage tail sheath protein FI